MKLFEFKPFVDGATAPHAQLQEWAEHYKVELKWEENTVMRGASTEWASYPIIQGHHYSEFIGTGAKLRDSHSKAAEMIIGSKGTLDEARKRSKAAEISRL